METKTQPETQPGTRFNFGNAAETIASLETRRAEVENTHKLGKQQTAQHITTNLETVQVAMNELATAVNAANRTIHLTVRPDSEGHGRKVSITIVAGSTHLGTVDYHEKYGAGISTIPTTTQERHPETTPPKLDIEWGQPEETALAAWLSEAVALVFEAAAAPYE